MNSMITEIPLSALVSSDHNVRQTGRTTTRYLEGIEALASSIAAQGLLQNLVVHPREDGTYAVDGGARRYAALQLLHKRGQLSAEYLVPCTCVDHANRSAASLAENTLREPMHPADEFEAFLRLTRQGWTIDRIADAFGVTPVVVERRLRLAKAAPELLERFRNDQLTTDQLIALCSTDDHAQQVAIWDRFGSGHSWAARPAELRRAVLEQEIDADQDCRVAFIGGTASYIAAGGQVRRDLFSDTGNSAILTDPALLDRLVTEKLESAASELRAEGWGWVEIWPTWDYTAFYRLGRVGTTPCLSEDARMQIGLLQAEAEALMTEHDGLHDAAEADARDLTEDERHRVVLIEGLCAAIEAEIHDIETANRGYPSNIKAMAGVVLAHEAGQLRVERGMVKPADRRAIADATGNGHAIIGGRETQTSGRKSDMSDALRRSLLGHRNLAAQVALAENPDVAKVLLACWAVKQLRADTAASLGSTNTPTDLRVSENTGSGTRTGHPIIDEAGIARATRFNDACATIVASLPTGDDALWSDLTNMSALALDSIIGHAIARSVSLAVTGTGLTGQLLATLRLSMAEHFTPTVDTYLGRIPKQRVLEALSEAGQISSEDDRATLSGMKKADLAMEAERRLAGTGWVPALLRSGSEATRR